MIAIARPEHRQLFHSALPSILLATLATLAGGLYWASAFGLTAFYPAKALLLALLVAAFLLHGLPRHHPFEFIGPANQTTLARASLVALLAGLLGEAPDSRAVALATAVAIVAGLLDAVDGRVARHTNTASAFGARFDMETDALFVFVLAGLAWQFGKAGAWVLLSGVLRYAFLALAMVMPSMRRPLPPSSRRKTIAALQMAALILAIAPFVTPTLSAGVAALALLALSLSFAADIAWLANESRKSALQESAQ